MKKKNQESKRKGRPKNAYYSVYDLDDNIIITGEIADICRRLDVVKSTITKALNDNRLIRRRYHIYPDYDLDDDDDLDF